VSEWPTGWFRDEKPAAPGDGNAAAGTESAQPSAGGTRPSTGGANGNSAPPGGGGPAPGAGNALRRTPGVPNDPTVRLPVRQSASIGAASEGGTGVGTHAPASPWPEQPPTRSAPGSRKPPPPRSSSRGGRRHRPRLRLVLAFIAGLVAILLILVIGGYFYLDSKLHREDILVSYAKQPAAGAGTNWLITGSDSRQGLTRRQERKYHTGVDISGQRSDTVMLLHIPASGPAILISLPRDSYVPIPGHGFNKLNAAYSFGGPKLLAETVQNATGLRVEHYMGIGFGGLVNVVNSVGGVTMCFQHSLRDAASGVHLKKGCHTLNGGQALAFVRTRHNFASQDLQREQNQRVFMKALLSKMTSAGVMLNPFATIPAALGSVDSITVDEGTHLNQLLTVAFALRHPETTTVPIANANYLTPAGDAVQWDKAQATELFSDLNAGRPVPKKLLTGSHLQG
jgi:LCP family protein required for cell wall assembly